jgi:hypothetical protein
MKVNSIYRTRIMYCTWIRINRWLTKMESTRNCSASSNDTHQQHEEKQNFSFHWLVVEYVSYQ